MSSIRILLVISLLIGACTAAKPNISIIDDRYNRGAWQKGNDNLDDAVALLNAIADMNPLLSVELGKIPEFQNWIAEENLLALERFTAFYSMHQIAVDNAFEKMYRIGLPDRRKYCTPLQALFWLIKDEQVDMAESVLYAFSLERLLNNAWILENNMYYHRWRWRYHEAYQLYHSCINPKLKQDIVAFYERNQGAVDYIISLAEQYPEQFGHQYRSFASVNSERMSRWEDFHIVVERVNAPELVHFYIYNQYFYEPNDNYTAEKTFAHRSGNSKALAELAALILKKAGYRTFVHTVETPNSPCGSLHSGAGIIIENGEYIVVVDMPKGKEIAGPFDLNGLEDHLKSGNCMPPPNRQLIIPIPNEAPHFTEDVRRELYQTLGMDLHFFHSHKQDDGRRDFY